MLNIVIFPVIFFFLHTSKPLTADILINANSDDKIEIYLVKQYWHTAIAIQIEDIDAELFPEVELFKDFKIIDIGWGDEEFYQHPGFDSGLALKHYFTVHQAH